MSAEHVVIVRRSRIVWSLSLVAGALAITSVGFDIIALSTGHDRVFGLRPLFDIDLEGNIPTLFSTCLLLLAASLLATNGRLESPTPGRTRLHWRILACIVLFMAVDEASRIHELTSGPMHQLIDGLGPAFRFAWVIPAMILCVVVAAAFLPFFSSLPSGTKVGFLMAGITYVGGAIGMELVGGAYLGSRPLQNDAIYVMIYTIEESLEMAGLIVLINTLLAHLESHSPEGRWRVQRA